jgi:hypothetical protein
MPSLTKFNCRLEGDWDVEPEQAWSAASESSLNPMSRLEDVSRFASGLPLCQSAHTTLDPTVLSKITPREYKHRHSVLI